MEADLNDLLGVAQQAAQLAATIHRAAHRDRLDVHTKSSATDLVTDVDRAAEKALVSALRQARPDDAIIGEEGTNVAGRTGVCWVLDPLDGTTNFVYGYPAYAVSVGVEIDGKRVLGVVHDTAHDRVYSGIVGGVASCDGTPIAASTQADLGLALIGTGFLPDVAARRVQGAIIQRLLPAVRDIRRSGSAALDLCAVASGTLDGFYEAGLGHWDIAGGAAIAEAAGAAVVELHSAHLPNPLLVVANPKLIETLVARLVEAGAA